MSTYVAVVFDTDAQAVAAFQELGKLNHNGDLTVHGASVVRRTPIGRIEVEQKQTLPGGLRTAVGASVGFLIGMLAGPAGAAAGAYAGATAGLGADVVKGGESREATDELESILRPGQSAVVAEISDDKKSVLGPTMHKLGGRLFSRPTAEVRGNFFDLDDASRRLDHDRIGDTPP